MSYTLDTSIQLGSSYTNKVLAATLIDINGNAVIAQSGITSQFKEIGNGEYLFHYTNYPSLFRGAVVISQSGNLHTNPLCSFSINPQEYEFLDVAVSSISNITVGTYLFTATTKDDLGNLVGNTTIELYPSGVGVLLQKTATNMSTAQANFNLDAGTYRAYIYNPTVAYWSNPIYFAINNDTSMDFIGTRLSSSAPGGSNLARIYAYVYDLGLVQLEGISMTISPSGNGTVVNNTIISEKVLKSVSDINGYVYIDVGANIPIKISIAKANFTQYVISPVSGSLNVASLI